ncbi:MAG: hypothetical protein AAF802_08440 [Planctomycetota bacterium]
MFDQLGNLDPVFADGPVDDPPSSRSRPLKRRKSLRECIYFILSNLLILPVVGTAYATIVAEGLRMVLPVFQLPLYKLPVPGAGLLRNYDGWDRLDLALVMALLLFVVVTWLWIKVFIELLGYGTVVEQRQSNPIVFYLLSVIAGVLLLSDAFLFLIGLQAKGSSGWSESPFYVAPIATLLYMCGLAVLGWWHADFKTSSLV